MATAQQRMATGGYGEGTAARYLTDLGMVVLDRNWRCVHGEIDIVARDGPTLVFCEVKTRRSARFGAPAEAVGVAKVGRLRRLATLWIAASGLTSPDVRFDVLSVLPQASGPASVEHLRGAF